MSQQDPCTASLSMEALFDYWSGELTEAEQREVEDHAFACDACTRRLQATSDLASGIAQVVGKRGGVNLPLTPSLLERLESQGLHLRHYRLAPGERVACTVGAEDDLLVAWLSADLGGAERVDVVTRDAQGKLMYRVEDAVVDRAASRVVFTFGGDLARSWPDRTVRLQVVAVNGDLEHALGEYTFDHTGFRAGA